MAQLTEDEARQLREMARRPITEPPLRADERCVAPTPEARARYVRFATQAALFYSGTRPVRFGGDHWKL